MTDVFGDPYAKAYDELYGDKDYDGECTLVEAIVAENQLGAKRVLDLGCGTGAHAVRLASRGYDVTGVDRSAAMLERAVAAARDLGATSKLPTFRQADLVGLELGETFDVALMLFAVLGYQLSNEDVLGALCAARRHLNDGGLLIFDVWYGPAVLHERPSDRVKVVSTEQGQLLRTATSSLDVGRHICRVLFRLWRLEGDRLIERVQEIHTMRFFFPLELEHYLEVAGFSPLRLGAFPDLSRAPDETTWSVVCVATAT